MNTSASRKAQKYAGWTLAWAWLLILLACGGGTVVVSPGASSSGANAGVNTKNEKPKEPSLSERVGQSVAHGGVEVSVDNAEIAVVELKALGQSSESQDELLQIVVRIENLSSAKKLNYRGWGSNALGINLNGASLRDEHGNSYKRIGFGFGTEAVGSLPNGDSIYPETTITDRLVFEVPVGAANYLELALPGDTVGIANSTFKLALRVPGKSVPIEEPAEPTEPATAISQPESEQASPVVVPGASTPTQPETAAIYETPIELSTFEQKESAEPLRTFKDASGKFSVDARMTAYGGGKVTLERADGKTSRVEFSSLSEDDQSWILAEIERRKNDR